MSLIERAVERIAGRAEPAQPKRPHDTVQAPNGVRPSLIEQAMSEGQASRADGVSAAAAPPIVTPREGPAPASRNVVAIDLGALKARGFVTPDTVHDEIGEEFRTIKRPLVENAFGRAATRVAHGRRIMVTSAFPGEGKSFCSINLAMCIAAERDVQVLLVDADVARPSIPRELGISTGAGLIDRLIDPNRRIDELVLDTNVEKLSLLPAGRPHEHGTELLASEAMAALLEELSNRYADRIIIFDSPPLLVTTAARALVPRMGQVALVVEAGRTPRDAVKDALAMIGDATVVGMILNKSPLARAAGYYGYKAYGYGDA
jgi:receptor protein-tyrosine kinase